jgi:hypothetical protein
VDDFYELIDLVSGNLAGDYDSIDDALAALHLVAMRHGTSAIEHFSLMRIHDDDQALVAMQEDLVRLVESFGRRAGDAKIYSQAS